MNENATMGKLIGVALTITVAVIILASALMPVINDAADDTVTYYNSGTRMSAVGADSITIEYSDQVISIADEEYPLAALSVSQGTVMIYARSAANGFYLYLNDYESGEFHRVGIQAAGTITLVYDGTAKTATINYKTNASATPVDMTLEYLGEAYYHDPDGKYVWYSAIPANAYVKEGTELFNTWSDGSANFYTVINGAVTHNGVSVEDAVIDLQYREIAGVRGVQVIDQYSITLAEGEEPITCRGGILEYEVIGESVVMSGYSGILYTIPVMIICALLVGAVAIVKREE